MKINEPEITVAFITCLLLMAIEYITGNHNYSVSAVIFSILLVKNLKAEEKNILIYIKRIALILLFLFSILSIFHF